MHALFQYTEAIAQTPFPVLITGETGVGKELFACAIHDLSRRKGGFVTVNAAGIDDTTFSDTLFGHTKGAYTGADKARAGLIEQAAGGTLFLDEIGDISQAAQTKLLRVIQNRDYFPLGSDVAKIADVRMVVATNKSLEDLKRPGAFRNDLFHRLRTHHIAVPPLRERKDDLPILVDAFLREAAEVLNKPKAGLALGAAAILRSYDFPGNVRELRGMIFDAVSVQRGRTLTAGFFRDRLDFDAAADSAGEAVGPASKGRLLFNARLPTIREATGALIKEALVRTGGRQKPAARLLGITPQALSRRLKYSRKERRPDS